MKNIAMCWNGLDGLINSKPFMPGANSAQQAEALMELAEQDGERLGGGERRLILEYARAVRDYTPETFTYSTAQVGDYVSEAVVDDAMDCLPPACMTSECAQIGEPYSHRQDPDTGHWRATYATFRRVTDGRNGIWEYRGHCFQGETTERGEDPPYVRLEG